MSQQMLGRYEIIESLGQGGMGEVLRARDTHLDREVALKVLTGTFTSDDKLLARFDREAKLLAAVNHPNIASIHSIEYADGKPFLVLELVEGQSLSDRLAARRVSLIEALQIGRQIAAALAAAHGRNVIHRDLKPANVMVTADGVVKLLDFGVAKALEAEAERREAPSAEQPTGSQEITTAGLILGTAPYMSPEQVRGKPLDARTDIWSFGCVLYEMLADQPAFQRETVGATLAAIIERDVDWDALPPATPEAIRALLRRCLQTDPAKRVQSADEVRGDIEETLVSLTGSLIAPMASASGGARLWVWVAAIATLFVATIWLGGMWLDRLVPAGGVEGASAEVAPLTALVGSEEDPALSPDGRFVAFAWDGGGAAGSFDLYVQQIGSGDPLRLTEGEGDVAEPAWAPDGSEIAFLRRTADGWRVETVAPLGGTTRPVTAITSVAFPGLSYAPSGERLAVVHRPSADASEAIFLIDRATGEMARLTAPGRVGEGDRSPAFSPDGASVAFVRWHELPQHDIYVTDLSGNARLLVSHDGFVEGLAWLPDGSGVVFCSVRGGLSRLWRVDLDGRSEPLGFGDGAKDVTSAPQMLVYARRQQDANLWVAGGPAAPAPTPPRRLIASTRDDWAPNFSPDGTRIAFMSNRSGEARVWICNADDGSDCAQLPTGGLASTPRWSPDGSYIAFGGQTAGAPDVRVMRVDGGTPTVLLAGESVDLVTGWSADSRWLYLMSDRTGRYQIWKVDRESGEPVQLTEGGGALPVGSADGRWVYYLREDEPLAIWRVSADGGDEALVFEHPGLTLSSFTVWNNQLLYFLQEPGTPVSAHLLDPETGATREFLRLPAGVRLGRYGRMTVSPDGLRIVYPQSDGAGTDLMLVRDFGGGGP